jgi:hypothetical protein
MAVPIHNALAVFSFYYLFAPTTSFLHHRIFGSGCPFEQVLVLQQSQPLNRMRVAIAKLGLAYRFRSNIRIVTFPTAGIYRDAYQKHTHN